MSKKILPIPDFIIAGAPKCGTTALASFLDEHPDVCMCYIKEPRFFTKMKGDMETTIAGDGPRLSGTFDNGYEWYASLFKNAIQGQKTGEASTVYFANADSAKLIYDHNPQMKLILMLRHPVKRLYSHYWQEYRLGFNFPSFEQMVLENHPRLRYYKQVSHYKTHLQRFYSYFPKDQLHILVQEEFVLNPKEAYDQMLKFIGLPAFQINAGKRYNDQIHPKSRRLARILTVLKTSGPTMRKIMPEAVFNMANKFRKKIQKINSEPLKYPPLSESLYRTLLEEYIEDIDYVEKVVLKKQIHLWHN